MTLEPRCRIASTEATQMHMMLFCIFGENSVKLPVLHRNSIHIDIKFCLKSLYLYRLKLLGPCYFDFFIDSLSIFSSDLSYYFYGLFTARS